jgi:hypothetical protein
VRARIGASLALALALIPAACGNASGTGGSTAPASADASARRAQPPLGAYLGSDQAGVRRIPEFQEWLGSPVTVGRTYLDGGTWSDIEGPDWIVQPWSGWVRQAPRRLLVLNVPMLPRNEAGLDDAEVARQLRAGASGDYDAHFRTLAGRLVDHGADHTHLILGWEMNGTTYTSRCGPDPSAWIGYWRRIVAAMRGVPGQHFQFDFAPVRGPQAVPWPDCYPGDDVVDVVAMDSYDQEPGQTFSDYVGQPYGLLAQVDFAARHGKPVAYPEWGLYDRGDDPGYVHDMFAWFAAHRVVYQSITDYCPHGVWRERCNPASSMVYRHLFGTR